MFPGVLATRSSLQWGCQWTSRAARARYQMIASSCPTQELTWWFAVRSVTDSQHYRKRIFIAVYRPHHLAPANTHASSLPLIHSEHPAQPAHGGPAGRRRLHHPRHHLAPGPPLPGHRLEQRHGGGVRSGAERYGVRVPPGVRIGRAAVPAHVSRSTAAVYRAWVAVIRAGTVCGSRAGVLWG